MTDNDENNTPLNLNKFLSPISFVPPQPIYPILQFNNEVYSPFSPPTPVSFMKSPVPTLPTPNTRYTNTESSSPSSPTATTFTSLCPQTPTTSSPFPTISWRSCNNVLINQMMQAKDGVMLLTDLCVSVPMLEVREVFCQLFQDPSLCRQLNEIHPPRGIYKYKSFMDKSIDQKVMVDFHLSDILTIYGRGINLGDDFNRLMDFYNDVQNRVFPRLIDLLSEAITGGIPVHSYGSYFTTAEKVRHLHRGLKHTFRLLDYPPIHKTGQRCMEHKDITSFTLIFQDRIQGGLEFYVDNKWIPVPTECEAILLWGWSSFILSNGRLQAPLYRVVPAKVQNDKKVPRRNEIIFYVTPELDANMCPTLLPLEDELSFCLDSVKDLTFGMLKDLFGAKWHKREGTTTQYEDQLLEVIKTVDSRRTQEKEIMDYLTGNYSGFNINAHVSQKCQSGVENIENLSSKSSTSTENEYIG